MAAEMEERPLLCWLPQEGPRLLRFMLIGARTLVGVSPVLPSIRESKLRLIPLLGVSILTPSIFRSGTVFSESDTGLSALPGLEGGRMVSMVSGPVRLSEYLGSTSGSDLTRTRGAREARG